MDKPVIFQGDRLEEEYKDVKSQWVGLLFWQESKNNVLEHTTIKNSIIGLRADSLADVKLFGCQISNTGSAGIIGRHASIHGENCLLFNNGSYGMQLTYGGNYLFNYCTVGSYEGQDEAVILTDFYCEDILCCSLNGCLKLNKLNATLNNCIFSGSGFDEVGISQANENDNDFNYLFNNCAFRVNDLVDPKNTPDFFDHCDNCINIKSNDKLFLSVSKDNYQLDTMSVVLGKGKFLSNVLKDILGKTRKPVPDIGCFEF
ncbi:MAG: hypothetical protein IPO92_23490 [Saprospiraceae bacterium]|nr:hypothetical protein [Saprospiraceae bacterium]